MARGAARSVLRFDFLAEESPAAKAWQAAHLTYQVAMRRRRDMGCQRCARSDAMTAS